MEPGGRKCLEECSPGGRKCVGGRELGRQGAQGVEAPGEGPGSRSPRGSGMPGALGCYIHRHYHHDNAR
eukprot:362783-Chlamydomonas_euryale.AAC.1